MAGVTEVVYGPLTFRMGPGGFKREPEGNNTEHITYAAEMELVEVRLTQEEFDQLDEEAVLKYGPITRIVERSELPGVLEVTGDG